MLATTRIPAATGTPALSKGRQQEKPQPQQQKKPATAGSVWKTVKKRAGHEARNMAVNVALTKKLVAVKVPQLAMVFARSGSEDLKVLC